MEAQKRKDERRQVKFECPVDFYQRLHEEKTRRNLTLQQLAIRALERYLSVPESVNRRIEEIVIKEPDKVEYLIKFQGNDAFEKGFLLAAAKGYGESSHSRLALEIHSLVEAIGGYLLEFPEEKLRLLEREMALDLKHYRTARAKPASSLLTNNFDDHIESGH